MENINNILGIVNRFNYNDEFMIEISSFKKPAVFNDLLAKTISIYEEICAITVEDKIKEELEEVKVAIEDGFEEDAISELGDVLYLLHRAKMYEDAGTTEQGKTVSDLEYYIDLFYDDIYDVYMDSEKDIAGLFKSILRSICKKMLAVELAYEKNKKINDIIEYSVFKEDRLYFENELAHDKLSLDKHLFN